MGDHGGRRRRPRVRVLEEDPDLCWHLPPAAIAEASGASLVDLEVLVPGCWSPDRGRYDERGLGLLVLDGLLKRRVVLAGRSSIELLGAGDLLRPWQHDHDCASIPVGADWEVCQLTRLAVLDRDFTGRMARWPSVLGELSGRAIRRSGTLGLLLVLAHLSPTKSRLALLLWHLADRWGTVEADGVFMPLRLSQETLGDLIGAQRETVSRCLRAMVAEGLITRRGHGWLLHRPSAGAARRL